MKRRILILSLLAAGLSSAQFGGGVIVCANCSTNVTQASQYAQEVISALRAVQMADLMVTEAVQLAKHPSTNIAADLSMLSSIMVQSQGLAGSMAQISQQFYNTYAPYNPNPLVNYASQYNQWAATTLRTLNGSLMATGYQGSMLQNEAAWTQLIQSMNNSPLGRDQSIQMGNTIALQEVAQLQGLRSLMLTDMQAKAAYMANQVNQQQATVMASQNAFGYAQPVASGKAW
jgi:P-type conjugative transfer protein TrbJ